MHKLIVAYRQDPSLANALKIKAWNSKHPFAAVLMHPLAHAELDMAIHHAETGHAPSWQKRVDIGNNQ